MPLSNLVFTAPQTPDFTAAGFRAASLVPNLQDAFIKGQQAAIAQQQAAQQYQQNQLKLQLAQAIAPELMQYQKAQLAAQIAALNGLGQGGGFPTAPVAMGMAPVQRGAPTQQTGPVQTGGGVSDAPYNYQTLGTPSALLNAPAQAADRYSMFGDPGASFLGGGFAPVTDADLLRVR